MSLILILALGLFLRVINLNQSFWLDEATSVLVARDFSFSDIITRFSPGDFHPPLYYFLLKIWIGIFGATEIGARSLSVILGSATIPLVFLIGRKLLNKETGLIAALFFATAPLHIYYSQETRMYATATFFTTLSAWFLLGTLGAKHKWHDWLGLVLASIFLIYTSYPAIFLFPAIFIYLVVFQKGHLKRYLTRWLLSFFIIALSSIFWLPILLQQLQTGLAQEVRNPFWWEILGRTSIKQLVLVPVKFLIGRISSYDKVFYTVSILPILFFAASLLLRSLAVWRKTALLWAWLIVPILAGAVLGLKFSGFSYFRFLFILPAFYLLLAAGSLSSKKEIFRSGGVLGLVLVNLVATSIYLFNPRFYREDWRAAVAWIEDNSKDKNAVALFVTDGQKEAYSYYTKSIPSYGPEGFERAGFDTIWLMRYVQPIFDTKDSLRQRVEGLGYQKVQERGFNGVVVWEYRKIYENRD